MEPFTLAILFLIALYALALVWAILKSKKQAKQGSQRLSGLVGMTTFVSTLFSAFTLMGVPNFFRLHGVGTWLFLGVTDMVMAFVVLWFGLKMRAYAARNQGEFAGVSQVLGKSYRLNSAASAYFAPAVYILGLFIFLIPYVSIQLRGISLFLEQLWGWPPELIGLLIVAAIFAVVQFGGFGAIVKSDIIQWIIVFGVIWIVGLAALSEIGGLSTGLATIKEQNPAWLSAPGPKNLFQPQFLIASFLAIILMPISQPQLTLRIALFRSSKDLRLGAAGVALCAFFVILPTLFVGLAGAVLTPDASAGEFWQEMLIERQAPIIGALAVLGIVAATMSTADSQLHSLRREFIAASSANYKGRPYYATIVLVMFFSLCYLFSILASGELVFLARISFAGTALLAPMVMIAFLSRERMNLGIPLITICSVLCFLLSQLKLLPAQVGGLRMDLVLICTTFALCFLLFWLNTPKHSWRHNHKKAY